jgi:hypothetical protein
MCDQVRTLFDVNLLIALFQPDHVHQEQRAVASRWKSRRRSATSPAWPRPTTQLGRVAHHRGDLTSAENWYRQTLEIKEVLGDRPGIALTYHNLGAVAHEGGDLTSAENWSWKSLEINEARGNQPGMALNYHQHLTEAEAWYRKSLEIKEALGDRPGMALTYGQLGC